MKMSFWWDYTVKDFFFYGFNIKSIFALIGTCFGLTMMAILFEFLKLLQAKQRRKELIIKSRQLRTICLTSETSTLIGAPSSEPVIITKKARIILYISDIVLWLSSFTLSYIIMLAVMVYNGWITIAILIGGGIGYFMFGQSFMKINLQNCQTLRETYCMLNCADSDPNNRNGESTPTAVPSTSNTDLPDIGNVAQVHVNPT